MIRPTAVVQITDICNFACDFCSASDLPKHSLSANDIITIIDKYRPHELNIEGGDPLTISPQVYLDIAKYVTDNHLDVTLSLTTNLWGWYKNPKKWNEVLRYYHICTSFQYGDKRKLANGTIFDQQLFEKIYHKFVQTFNRRPSFMAVIDYDNCDKAVDHALLAKALNTTCVLRRARKSGRCQASYPRDQMMKIYADIITQGLGQYETTCKRLVKIINNENQENVCALGIKDCYNKILYFNNFGARSDCNTMFYSSTPLIRRELIGPDCILCPAYHLCNNCVVQKSEIALLSNQRREQYCNLYRESLQRIIDYVSPV